jgi:hypothetical protein
MDKEMEMGSSTKIELAYGTFITGLISSFSNSIIKLSKLIRPSVLTIYLTVICCLSVGTVQAGIIPYGSLLEVEGRAFQGDTPIITTVTQTQGAMTNTLIAEDNNAVTNGQATTNASATWVNVGQGTVNFSEVSLFLGPTIIGTSVENSGLFTYDFQADISGLFSVDYIVESLASGINGNFYLNNNLFSIQLRGDNGYSKIISLEQNTSGNFIADVVGGVDYLFSIRRNFLGSSTLNTNSQILIDATQSASFNWQIPSSDTVSVPAPPVVWLMIPGLLVIVWRSSKQNNRHN